VPNFTREFRLWEIEEEKVWHTVGRRSYAHVVQQPFSGANSIPLGRRATQKHISWLSFLHRLSAKEAGFLESAISVGHGLEQILQAFRFGDDDSHVTSFLDSLSNQQIQELHSFIASKPSKETLAQTFYAQQSTHNSSPMPPVLAPQAAPGPQHFSATVSPTVTGLAMGAENPIQMHQPWTSVFQRLDPAQAQLRVSAFDRLVFPPPFSDTRQ
jgi:hypothetical protein